MKLEATVAELTPGGDGVAICEIEGERRAIFVAGVVAGERVRVDADLSRRPARARLLEVLEPSAARATPPCPHAERCGGCDWMHLSPDEQMRAHAKIVEKTLPKGFAGAQIVTHAASRTDAYRTRARVHVDARRGKVVTGMFARASHDPVAVDACLVLDPILDDARSKLASILEGAKGRGDAQLAKARNKAVLELRWNGDLPAAVFGRLERAVNDGALAGARVWSGAVKLPATIGDPTPWIVAADGEPLRLAPGGFSQATEAGNVVLSRRVVELSDEIARGAPTTELFAGSGNLTVLLARTRSVVAVELDRAACEAARANLAARKLSAKVVEADAAEHTIAKDTRLVVLDPPRVGARAVAEALAKKPVADVVYVSCDPPTLGRDLEVLAGAGYRLHAIETFEMFPHTSHVESVAALVGPKRAKK